MIIKRRYFCYGMLGAYPMSLRNIIVWANKDGTYRTFSTKGVVLL